MSHNKRETPKWVTKSCDNRYDEVCGWNSIKDVASCLVFNPFWENFDLDLWPKVKVIDTWVIECALLGCTYLGTKYEVCRWNSLRDMPHSLFFYTFWGKFDFDHWPWPKVKVIGTWVIECALLGCTLVPIMKSVGEIASKIWPVLWFFTHFWENLTLTFDLDLRSRSSALGSLNAPYWVVPWYQVWSL